MRIINFFMHRMLKQEAADIVTLTLKEYNTFKVTTLLTKEEDILRQVFYNIWGILSEEDLKIFKEKTVQKIKICCESLHGICYLVGLDSPFGYDLQISRCLQFTYYIDMELERRGFPRLAYHEKLRILEPLELAELYKQYGELY